MLEIIGITVPAPSKKAGVLTIFYGILTLAYMAVIYHFSSLPGSQISLPAPDHVMHALEYLGLGVLLGLTTRSAINMHKTRSSWSRFLVPVLVGFAYALSDEFHQLFIPGRTASISDLMADLLGIVAAQIVLQRWLYVRGG